MPESSVYEYAAIRLVPCVEREEFINVGVILYCPKEKFLSMVFFLDESRLRAFSKEIDASEIQSHLEAWQAICAANKGSGPIGLLPIGERFRWLTATRSTVLQTSRVHIGYCTDPKHTLIRLGEQLVK